MKKNNSVFLFFGLPLLLSLLSCEDKPSGKKHKKEKVRDGVVKSYYDEAKKMIKAEVTMKNGKQEGSAIQYYKSGRKALEMFYKDGLREGMATRYFENGTVGQQTMYAKDKMHGIQKKFKESGKLLSEAEFYEDKPCKGLKEYLIDGTLKAVKDYPKIVIKPIDRIFMDGMYVLKLSLSEKAKEVEFYTGVLTNQKYIGMDASRVWSLSGNKNEAEIVFTLPPGSLVMEKLNIIAKFKTVNGNYYITEVPYNVAVENRH
jgi:hypothetical protein